MAAHAYLLGQAVMSGHVEASSNSVLASLQTSDAKSKLKTLESKEMHGCFFSDDGYDCPWTQEEWKRILDVVIGLASNPHPRVRESVARYMIISSDARVVEPLGRLLMDTDLGVRRVAVRAFLTIGLAQHEDHILRRIESLLEDEWPSIRRGAAAALGATGTQKSLAKLRKAYQHETDQGTRSIMKEAITGLEGKGN